MTVEEIFTRTSVRSFDGRPVPEEDVELMLKAAMHAPSAMNQQCWEFFVVDDVGLLQGLSRAAPYAGPVGRAPMAIVLAADKGRMKAPKMWQQDLAAAAQNILLAAKSRGIGTVWIGIAPHPDRMAAVSGIMGLPEGLKPFCVIAVGYPFGDVVPNEGRYKPERVHRNRFVAKDEASSLLRAAFPGMRSWIGGTAP
ncbi:MAG: nitroreductase family protein [Candidatus Methanomethylophilaceae archaeon]|nr:nitroreductase family protein [Candidatus Methanomethylophilaceae archaeon]